MVLGISRDTVKDQKKFKDKYELPYDLLADPEMVLIKRYGLLKDKTMYGKPVTGVERTTYRDWAGHGQGAAAAACLSRGDAGGARGRGVCAAEGELGQPGRSDVPGVIAEAAAGAAGLGLVAADCCMRRCGRRRRSLGGR